MTLNGGGSSAVSYRSGTFVLTRGQHGNRMAFMGGLDKLILPEGKQAIDRELESKIPAMLELDGYIPSLDHRVVVETSLLQFGYYVKRVRELMGQEELAECVPHSDVEESCE